MTERDKILERIANLRARAEDNGSSEAEIEAAMNKAEKLMQAYRVDEAELALAESEGRITIEVVSKVASVKVTHGKRRHKVIVVLGAIECLTNTKCVMWTGSTYDVNYGKLEFTGDKPDVEYADYLVALIRAALDNEYADYRRKTVGVGRGAKASFQTAMANTIASRLYAMARESDAELRKAASGESRQIADKTVDTKTALVLVDAIEQKKEAIQNTFKTNHPRLRSARPMGYSYGNGTAYSAGRKAGERVNLGRSVGFSKSSLIGA